MVLKAEICMGLSVVIWYNSQGVSHGDPATVPTETRLRWIAKVLARCWQDPCILANVQPQKFQKFLHMKAACCRCWRKD